MRIIVQMTAGRPRAARACVWQARLTGGDAVGADAAGTVVACQARRWTPLARAALIRLKYSIARFKYNYYCGTAFFPRGFGYSTLWC